MLHKNKSYSIHYYNISKIYFGVFEITVYCQNAGMAKKLKATLRSERSERATEGVQIGSGGNLKLIWMWELFADYFANSLIFGKITTSKVFV